MAQLPSKMPLVATAALVSALCLGPARARTRINQHPDQGTIRYQIARHLHQAGFSRTFPLNQGYRDIQSIARNLEFKVSEGKARRANGADMGQVSWRIKDTASSRVPRLGGTANIWTYAQGDRPAYVPTTDVGDVQITRGSLTSKSWNTSPQTIGLRQQRGETWASFARRCVSSYLDANGFSTLVQTLDADQSSIQVNKRGSVTNWKAGKITSGDRRTSYAMGGQLRLTRTGVEVSVNKALVTGWRVAAPRNGSGRRTRFPTGGAMPRYRAYGRTGR